MTCHMDSLLDLRHQEKIVYLDTLKIVIFTIWGMIKASNNYFFEFTFPHTFFNNTLISTKIIIYYFVSKEKMHKKKL